MVVEGARKLDIQILYDADEPIIITAYLTYVTDSRLVASAEYSVSKRHIPMILEYLKPDCNKKGVCIKCLQRRKLYTVHQTILRVDNLNIIQSI